MKGGGLFESQVLFYTFLFERFLQLLENTGSFYYFKTEIGTSIGSTDRCCRHHLSSVVEQVEWRTQYRTNTNGTLDGEKTKI